MKLHRSRRADAGFSCAAASYYFVTECDYCKIHKKQIKNQFVYIKTVEILFCMCYIIHVFIPIPIFTEEELF